MKNEGFTIIELFTVIAIIFLLIGIGVPAYDSWRNRARIAKARSMISAIELALERYKTDNGVYPNDGDDLNDGTILNQGELRNFLTVKPEDLDGAQRIIDPWNRPYIVYVDNDENPSTYPAGFSHNRSTCYIYSQGPNDSITTDDIDNFQPM